MSPPGGTNEEVEMQKVMSKRPSLGTVMGFLALLIALGGVATAEPGRPYGREARRHRARRGHGNRARARIGLRGGARTPVDQGESDRRSRCSRRKRHVDG